MPVRAAIPPAPTARSRPQARRAGWRSIALSPSQARLSVMSLVFIGSLLSGYALLPGDNERIAMLERDGQRIEALRLLENRFANGDRGQRTVFQLQQLYEYFGELEKARTTLDTLAALRPRDKQVQRQLAQFYRQTQDEDGYVLALQRQLAARYAEPVCRELIGIFRLNGDYAREQSTLEECRSRGYRRPEDIIRLAYLTATGGQLATAAILLRSVDERRRLKVDRDRHMLFTALLETDQAVEAQRRATRWLKGSADDQLALQLIDGLARASRFDLALDLAREVGIPGDSVSLSVSELMLDRDEIIAARSYLRGWLEAARLRDVDVAERFTSAALDADDPELAFRGADRFGLQRLPQSSLVSLAEALSAIGQTVAFGKVREALDPQTVAGDPLLAAAVEADRGATDPALQLLGRVETDSLDQWRLSLWARLMVTTGRRTTAAQALREIGVEPPPAPTQSRAIRRYRDARYRRARARLRPRAGPVGAQAGTLRPRPGAAQSP